MGFVKVYVKKQIQLDKMNVGQKEMLALSSLGLRSIKERVQNAQNTQDGPAKPLARGYAVAKMKMRGIQKATGVPVRPISNRRDLTLTGKMLANLGIRSVSENRAFSGWTSLKERLKATNNQRLEAFVDFSPKNTKVVFELAQKLVAGRVKRLVITRGGVVR